MQRTRDTLAAVLAGLPAVPAVQIEQPRWSLVKRRSDGRVDFVSPVPCPYNYGCIPAMGSGDGDPLDALVLGPRIPRDRVVRVPVVCVVDFLDGGRDDPKVVCSDASLTQADVRGLLRFFTVYALFKRALAAARGRSTEVRLRGLVAEALWQRPTAAPARRE